ncbi:MAG: tRNA (adenosine(37)-N6)-threonylcarbamoyltransferase complex dimerization subunit type 1 TsaB [Candidatus Cloacimonetes bacterium 4572_55]|nr:MAG: tRNA (adenosine(37)-N6)-threonylcarbamoyltransferase complex dimerization subunit type 1 TsaB [Candidatus Cloacimonetes bacterium 4572_55]
MRILAIETASMQGSAAIQEDCSLIAEYSLNVRATHSERLLSAIDTILHHSGLRFIDLDGLAISIGPGSFTGLRIGLSTIKGLSFSTGLPVVAVSTLRAMATRFLTTGHLICPCLDARKKEIYTALYADWIHGDGKNSLRELSPPQAIPPDIFLKGLAENFSEPVIFSGDGAKAYLPRIKKYLPGRALIALGFAGHPQAGTVAYLGMERLRQGKIEDVVNLEPFYLRKSEAEIKWVEKHG